MVRINLPSVLAYNNHPYKKQILLDAGADVNLSNNQEKDSVLLIATKNKNEEMLKLLLKANANTDADSQFGRKSAVMQACLSGSDALLKVCILTIR